MTEEIRFFVSGPPQPKARVRFTRTGKPYTPANTRSYERTVKAEALAAALRAGWRPSRTHEYAVTLWIRFSDRRRRDLDNVQKAVLDAMNTVVYLDDSQVFECHVYRELGHARSGVVVCVRRRPK